MDSANKRLAQRLIAIIVIIAILEVIGFNPAIIVFFLIAGLVIWRAMRRSEYQETERTFEFYIAADEVLRDEGRQWYGFEIAEVIDAGERVVLSFVDPPPLTRFTLGALYHRVGDFEPAVDHLTWVVEGTLGDEVHCTTPSPQLRRYVETLRRIERDPAVAPQTLAAVRNLERARRKRSAELLAESRQGIVDAAIQTGNVEPPASAEQRNEKAAPRPLSSITAPPPISEVLRDVYQSEEFRN
ncbi:MAG TPA: hypothetical protein VE135_01380 [Pyrinomonadaceae bacterium]|nr:hypothetical protein [Pyrinomonadaceae bacterium]